MLKLPNKETREASVASNVSNISGVMVLGASPRSREIVSISNYLKSFFSHHDMYASK